MSEETGPIIIVSIQYDTFFAGLVELCLPLNVKSTPAQIYLFSLAVLELHLYF